ncbi:MAG: NUDIX domain-containing protein [Leucobacter sp.]
MTCAPDPGADAAPDPRLATGAPNRVIRVSAVVMRDGRGRVLNVRKRGTTSLMLPGGKHEAGEDPRSTAVREFGEELGIALERDRLAPLGVFRAAAANEPGHTVEATVFEHPFLEAAAAARARAEIEHVEWVDPAIDRPDMAPLNTGFVFPALAARRAPTTA